MMEDKYDDTFLAKWLSGDISEEEKTRFETTTEYQDYIKIIEGTNQFEAPSFDKQSLLSKIKDKQDRKETKRRRLVPSWMYAAAAVILLVVGFTYVFTAAGETFETGYGNQMTVALPDGSEAILNAKSSITFDKELWEDNRTVSLTGEAYFKVKKGEKFTVSTDAGTIEVLGTQFNVKTAENLFEVKCTEGKVRVETSNSEKAILTVGKAFSKLEGETTNWDFDIKDETWREGESNFRVIPLKHVITAIQNQYNITIIHDNIDTTQRFTGSFSHKNLKLALRTVFVPMEISYTFKDENTVILKKAE
ncbi:FecR domain-containing protein [uncultured Kordia sp.]|uniref:FecR family protein n=1 Tax=uncultured Kordia sp. TaxID=507699 RepID=UPI00260362DB|nr:FecR domain-containing protein [uncultured Kordia sp.]